MRCSRRVSKDRTRRRVEGSEPGEPVDLPDEARARGQAVLRCRVLQQVRVHLMSFSNIIFAHFFEIIMIRYTCVFEVIFYVIYCIVQAQIRGVCVEFVCIRQHPMINPLP